MVVRAVVLAAADLVDLAVVAEVLEVEVPAEDGRIELFIYSKNVFDSIRKRKFLFLNHSKSLF